MHQQFIIGLQGLVLSAQEINWIKQQPPLGIILFGRNVDSPAQVKALLAEVRQHSGQATWAAIDEEGGRVNRMPWSPFNQRRHAAEYGVMYQRNAGTATQAVYQDSACIAEALHELGFTHNCAPVLDVFHPAGHGIIGQRAYGGQADQSNQIDQIATLATACMRGLADAGIQAVGKHYPGHGRANADSHVAVAEVDAPLTTVLAESETFSRLIDAGLNHIMTAHVIYRHAADDVATLSPFWLQQQLRQKLGFSGHIWSDDLCMKGVGEDINSAAQAALKAGCDALLICEPDGVREIYEHLSPA